MNRLYRCKKCRAAFIISEMDPNLHLLKKVMRCPNSQTCGGKQYLLSETNLPIEFQVERVSAIEFYQATMGVGLPKEKKCAPSDIRKLLVGAKVKDVHLDASPDAKRSIVFSITLENGKVIHLASSTRGATIYRVTEASGGR